MSPAANPIDVHDDPLDALTRVLMEHRGALVDVARREGVLAADAVDVVQDALCTWLALASRGEAPTSPDEIPAHLRAVVRNAARNRRRRHHLACPHLDVELATDDAHSSESLVSRAEDRVRLRACVARLCETQRAVVTLRMLAERPGEDVAAALGITRSHVDVLLHRAKAALRACMTE